METKWANDLVFDHPKTGVTTIIQDAETADIFLTHYWGWALTTEFHEAVWACEASKGNGAGANDLRPKVRDALRSVGILVD